MNINFLKILIVLSFFIGFNPNGYSFIGHLFGSDSNEVHLVGVGDILLHTALQREAIPKRNRGGFANQLRGAKPYIEEADIAYGNVEGPIADSHERQSGQFSFNFPSFLVRDLLNTGFDVVSMANNHSLDRGKSGLMESIETLEDYRLPFNGIRKDSDRWEGFYSIVKANGIKTAWLSCTTVGEESYSSYVAGCKKHKKLLSLIIKWLKVDQEVDFVVLAPHWGEEKEEFSNSSQKSLAKYYFARGVDLIFGSHPHVLQEATFMTIQDDFGQTKRRLVFYSLGNFLSNQLYWGYPQKVGAMANVYLEKKKGVTSIKNYNVIPTEVFRHPYRIKVYENQPNHPVSKFVRSKGLIVK